MMGFTRTCSELTVAGVGTTESFMVRQTLLGMCFYGSFNGGLPASFNFLFSASLFLASRAGCTK